MNSIVLVWLYCLFFGLLLLVSVSLVDSLSALRDVAPPRLPPHFASVPNRARAADPPLPKSDRQSSLFLPHGLPRP